MSRPPSSSGAPPRVSVRSGMDVRGLEFRLTLAAVGVFSALLAGFAGLAAHLAPSIDMRPLVGAGIAATAVGAGVTWAMARRIRHTVRARERALNHAAFHDTDTGLPNRLGLERRLAGLESAQPVFVAAFGIERYAQMRGVLGHDHCARMHRRLASALTTHQPTWIVARPAADIIGAAFPAANLAEAKRLAAEAGDRLQAAQVPGGQGVDVRVVTGLSTGSTAPTGVLLTEADIALDAARAKRARAAVFDPVASARSADTLGMMAALRDAIAAGDLSLVHQPKLDLRTRTLSGVECLVRWTDPVRGPIPPDRFIAIAEETGDIRALSEWVLVRAVQDQAAMAAAGRTLTMSVNLSGRLVGDVAFTRAVVAAAGQAKGRLCMEVTETAVIARPDAALEQLRRFREKGVSVAIDDYGSGLSSLTYLKTLEADELKIDKSLVTALPRSPRDAILVRSTVDLAHALGMTCTAEGVEDEETCALLGVIGCDHAQGWHVGRPLPLGELLATLDGIERAHEAA